MSAAQVYVISMCWNNVCRRLFKRISGSQ